MTVNFEKYFRFLVFCSKITDKYSKKNELVTYFKFRRRLFYKKICIFLKGGSRVCVRGLGMGATFLLDY